MCMCESIRFISFNFAINLSSYKGAFPNSSPPHKTQYPVITFNVQSFERITWTHGKNTWISILFLEKICLPVL